MFLIDYVIVTSQIKTTKVAFTYYIITDGEGVSEMLMHGYEGWGGGWSCDDRCYWVFLQISVFH